MVLENVHKIRFIAKLLCKIGRHDFEYAQSYGVRTALLQCVYCGREKSSTRPRGSSDD